MRLAIKIWLALVGTAALVATAPAAFASAAPVGQPRAPVAIRGGHAAIGIPLTPGSHAVVETVSLPVHSGVTLRNAAAQSGPVASESTPEVEVRVGKNNCAGFNGQVVQGITPGEPPISADVAWVQVYGTAWDDCGVYTYPTTVYVYVNYSCLLCSNVNYSVGSVYDGGPQSVSSGINSGERDTPSGFGPSGITVTACLKWNAGWGCGAGKKV